MRHDHRLNLWYHVCHEDSLQMTGALLAPMSLLLMVYALAMYRARTYRILQRDSVRYDDQCGPAAITILLILSMLVAYTFSLVIVMSPAAAVPVAAG